MCQGDGPVVTVWDTSPVPLPQTVTTEPSSNRHKRSTRTIVAISHLLFYQVCYSCFI